MCHAYRESTRFTPPFYDFAKAARDGWVVAAQARPRVGRHSGERPMDHAPLASLVKIYIWKIEPLLAVDHSSDTKPRQQLRTARGVALLSVGTVVVAGTLRRHKVEEGQPLGVLQSGALRDEVVHYHFVVGER